MNVKNLRSSIKEKDQFMRPLTKCESNFDRAQKKFSRIEFVRKSLKKMALEDKSCSMNEFEKAKLEIDIELLNKNIQNRSDEDIKNFKVWLNQRKTFTKSISKSLNRYESIYNNFKNLFKEQTISENTSADKLEKMKSEFYIKKLLRLMINYGEILAIKDSLENNNLEPAKIYIKLLIKILYTDDFNKSLDIARNIFRDDGSIPNKIKDVSMKGYKEFSLIVLEALQNLEIEGGVVNQIINTIHKRLNDLLKEYQVLALRRLKNIGRIGGYSQKKIDIVRCINRTLENYLAPDIMERINRINKNPKPLNKNDVVASFDDQEF